jgi:Flp pilus assembly pilin Flp
MGGPPGPPVLYLDEHPIEDRVATIRRLFAEDEGQDLVEYAFLGAFIAVVGVVVWNNIVTLLGLRYAEYNSNTQQLWDFWDWGPP